MTVTFVITAETRTIIACILLYIILVAAEPQTSTDEHLTVHVYMSPDLVSYLVLVVLDLEEPSRTLMMRAVLMDTAAPDGDSDRRPWRSPMQRVKAVGVGAAALVGWWWK